MSGIAEVLANQGCQVSGSDLKETEITRRLRAAGVKVRIGHAAANARGAQAVVVSSAVAADNPEVAWARRRGVPVVARALMLAELGRGKRMVTVAGSHGKTTTTSMVAMALDACGVKPTAIIGGVLKNIGKGARLGTGSYFVAEADESDGSFVHLTPVAAVVTNIDDDHLDFHGSLENLKKAFRTHLERLPFYGAAVLCADDPALRALAKDLARPVVTYGLKSAAQWQARDVKLSREGSTCEVRRGGRRVGTMRLRVPGRHNVLNALGALAAGEFLGLPTAGLLKGLAEFRGVGRRLDRLGSAAGVEFIDDYGHHPTEVAATLDAVKGMWPKARLVAVFQPHRYSRTKLLADAFGTAFKQADLVLLTPIYAAGEKSIKGVTSGLILDSLRKAGVRALPIEGSLEAMRQIKRGDVVLTLGAGDVWKLGEDLLRRLR
jgi:UDP-N-acetylmuramate--alanine ligase